MMNQHVFAIPSGPTNSNLLWESTGWSMYVDDDSLIIAGDCTREQAEAALAQNITEAQAAEAARIADLEAKEAARLSARARLKSQGFTDAEIDVMYPTLAVPIAVA